MIDSPGLTARRFFESLSDQEVRQFIEPEILSALDAIFGGRILGEDLRTVALTLVDIGELLGEEKGRQFVIEPHPTEEEGRTRVPDPTKDIWCKHYRLDRI